MHMLYRSGTNRCTWICSVIEHDVVIFQSFEVFCPCTRWLQLYTFLPCRSYCWQQVLALLPLLNSSFHLASLFFEIYSKLDRSPLREPLRVHNFTVCTAFLLPNQPSRSTKGNSKHCHQCAEYDVYWQWWATATLQTIHSVSPRHTAVDQYYIFPAIYQYVSVTLSER